MRGKNRYLINLVKPNLCIKTMVSVFKVIFLSFLYLLAFGCVPLQQQIIDDQNEKLSHYEPLELIISANKFQETLHPQFK